MGVLETLEAQRIEIAQRLKTRAQKAIEESGGQFSEEDMQAVEQDQAAFVDATKQIERARSLLATRDEVVALLDADEAKAANESALRNAVTGLPKQRMRPGETFVKSQQYTGMMKAFGGTIPETHKGINSGPVPLAGGLKALLTGADHDTSAGVLVQPQQLGVVAIPTTPLALRQLVTVGSTTSDKIEYAQVMPYGTGPNDSTNNAAGIPEATSDAVPAPGPAAGGVKPQSAIKFRKKSADVITIAHWIAATKRALSDASQLLTLINAFLTDGIARKVEELIISGDADAPTAPDLEEWDGILNTDGVQDVAFDTDLMATTRHMITAVAGVGGNLSAFAVSPAVAEELDLAKDNTGRYLGAGPWATTQPTLWGRPLVTVYGLDDDVIIGGEWSTCVLWDRESTTITATDAHEDFFIRNLVAILAEARAAFGILNPQLMAVGHTA